MLMRVPRSGRSCGVCGAAAHPPRRRIVGARSRIRLQPASATSSAPQGESSSPPAWAGEEGWVSRIVNSLIDSPLYDLILKPGAYRMMVTTAEEKGISWNGIVDELGASMAEIEIEFEAVLREGRERNGGRSLEPYPHYYVQPFHAYEDGNLSFKAAFEVEPATYAMATRVYPAEKNLPWEEAQQRLRDAYTSAVSSFASRHAGRTPSDIVDLGCSVGVSTISLAAAFPDAASVTGIDLSPFFLAVARLRSARGAAALPWRPSGLTDDALARITWLHAKAEATPLPDASQDLVSLSFVSHELPQAATRAIFAEAMRLLRPGGTFVMCDNDPQSPVIRNLPPPIFTLMKSTEPWSDEYYTLPVEASLSGEGFVNVCAEEMDPRHRVVLAMKPHD